MLVECDCSATVSDDTAGFVHLICTSWSPHPVPELPDPPEPPDAPEPPDPLESPVPPDPDVPLVPEVPAVPDVPLVPVVPTELVVPLPLSADELSALEVPVGEVDVEAVLVEVGAVLDWLVLSSCGRGVRPMSPMLVCEFSMLLVPTAVWVVLPLPVLPVDMTFPDPPTVVWLLLPLPVDSLVTAVLLL